MVIAMKNKRQIAKKIERWLMDNGMDNHVSIYFDDERWSYGWDGTKDKVVENNIKASRYFTYADDDTISMAFEGPLYEVLNLYRNDEEALRMHSEFSELLNEYGYFFEKGNAWNCTACKI
jgi:hypothetical protein